jgi:hypothetical protein
VGPQSKKKKKKEEEEEEGRKERKEACPRALQTHPGIWIIKDG